MDRAERITPPVKEGCLRGAAGHGFQDWRAVRVSAQRWCRVSVPSPARYVAFPVSTAGFVLTVSPNRAPAGRRRSSSASLVVFERDLAREWPGTWGTSTSWPPTRRPQPWTNAWAGRGGMCRRGTARGTGCTTCSSAGSGTAPGSTSSPGSKPRSRRSAAEVRQGNGRLGTPPGRCGPSGPGDPRRSRSRAVDGQRARLHTTLGELRRLLHEATGDPDSLHLALHHTQKAVEASRSGQWP